MVAAVNVGALDEKLIRDGYMDDAEDYILQLRNHLIKYGGDGRITGMRSSGARDERISEGYILYITYKFQVRPL